MSGLAKVKKLVVVDSELTKKDSSLVISGQRKSSGFPALKNDSQN
jgi:hypothetical protein